MSKPNLDIIPHIVSPNELYKICTADYVKCNSILLQNLIDADYHDVVYVFHSICYFGHPQFKLVIKMLIPFFCKRKIGGSKFSDRFNLDNDEIRRGIDYAIASNREEIVKFLTEFCSYMGDESIREQVLTDISIKFHGDFELIKQHKLTRQDITNIGRYCDDLVVVPIYEDSPICIDYIMKGAIFSNNWKRVSWCLNEGASADNEILNHMARSQKSNLYEKISLSFE